MPMTQVRLFIDSPLTVLRRISAAEFSGDQGFLPMPRADLRLCRALQIREEVTQLLRRELVQQTLGHD